MESFRLLEGARLYNINPAFVHIANATQSRGARRRHGESTYSLPLVRGTPSARTTASIYRPTVPTRTTPRYSTTRTAKPAYQPTCRSNYPSRCAGLGLYDVEYRHIKPWRFGRIFFLRGVDEADAVTVHGRTGQPSAP
ncbi:hypothetical protein J1614_009822 [Plenodomus biglobosus]|nr:hypothetical protein J1614_009822 [Plenodomus biglobosus]